MAEFEEQVADLSRRSRTAEKSALTEEATKTSVILPFLQTRGFDVFNLEEVIPEFTADVGTRRGEKVDFAVKIDGKIAMLVEAKPIGTKLGDSQFNQLYRYFSVTDARLGVLTNGKEVWFFSDTDEPNRMDKRPFFKFDFQSHDAEQVKELARFRKDTFEVDAIIEAASNLKYVRAAANYFKEQMDKPDESFVRFVAKSIHDGAVTRSVVEQLTPAIKSALDELIRDRIQDKLGVAFRADAKPSQTTESEQTFQSESDIETTDEELQAFMIVRAIGARITDIERITIRDAKTYCAVLMDDNNRKPICRFYFNSATTKNVGIMSPDKTEMKNRVNGATDLYQFAAEIEETIKAYA